MEDQKKPKKTRGASKEVLVEIGKKGVETNKKKGIINKYEKQKKQDEFDKKYKLIQEELAKKNAPPQEEVIEQEEVVEQEEVEEEIEEEVVPVVKAKKQRKQRVVEVVEEVEETESEEESEEEEVIVKKIIKKVPRKKKEVSNDELYQMSNQEILKRRLYEDTRKRVMSNLFDY